MFGLIIFTVTIAYLLIAVLVVKRLQSRKAIWIVLTVFVMITTWDQIVGRAYFYTLCATQGGLNINSTVALESSYFDERGLPRFITTRQNGAFAELAGRYQVVLEAHTLSKLFHIDENRFILRDKKNNDILGTDVSYLYFGGWMHFAAHRTAERCPPRQADMDNELYRAVFKRL